MRDEAYRKNDAQNEIERKEEKIKFVNCIATIMADFQKPFGNFRVSALTESLQIHSDMHPTKL